MNETKTQSSPNYTSQGIAVWENLDKNGKKYLNIKIVGHSPMRAFEYTPQTKEEVVSN